MLTDTAIISQEPNDVEQFEPEAESDYMKYRGKCKEFCDAAVAADPTLTLVRGHYYDFSWGKQPHWWTVRQDGTIYDPTAKQFPSKGTGEYEPFDGMCECEQCGKQVAEEDAVIYGNYAFCSNDCIVVCCL